MSIFTLTPTPLQTTGIDTDRVYDLKCAYIEMMDALDDAKAAVSQANRAAKSVNITTDILLENAVRDELTILFWKKFLRPLPVMDVMSSERQEKEIENWLYPSRERVQFRPKPEPPDFTVENMLKRASELESRREFFICEWAFYLFEHHVHWRPQLENIVVPQKIVLSHRIVHDGVAYRDREEVANLDRFFYFMDGRNADFPRQEADSPLVKAIAEAVKQGNGRGETDYFRFAAYGNGNLHLTFKRRDLMSLWEKLAREGLVEHIEA